MRVFECVCSTRLFFDNSQCLSCGREVGWCPACDGIHALEPLDAGGYRCTNPECGASLLKCANYRDYGVCNRMVELDGQGGAPELCDCCRCNEMIPDLSVDGALTRWAALESAKRRLFYTLDLVELPHPDKHVEGAPLPLSFSFMADALPNDGLWRQVGDQTVYTGHANGHITINVREADDAERERLRVDMGEAHRTLIGHFRHEIGHYYWDLLVQNRDEAACIAVFGDHNSPTYAEALERHYHQGPPAGWELHYVSAYATMHPWEDFAETFALYLDIVSVLDTAKGLGFTRVDHDRSLDQMLIAWQRVGLSINELNRDMGLLDLVPVVLNDSVVEKLRYIDGLVKRACANAYAG
ncbi:zinc-binding metallopeptidase family protein [Halotalea alkalilenta]|uniref:zinc-binding metallopeptidase family protein n=1 Tax=Halotalea alkalilenta TaxID=376489 RepID=UPI00047F8438|nr:putative zinc-binding metallopeptidase [Halotalea alkalilenta]